MHDIFTFDQTGMNANLEAEGCFGASGIRPLCLDRLRRAGIDLPAAMFERGERDIGRLGSMGLERCLP